MGLVVLGKADAVDERTDVVAFSAVQSSNGEVADLDAVAEAARAHGALTVVDATHAAGWLPLDAARFDAVACAGYKWLLSPRGTAYLYVAPELLERVPPLHAGWFAGAVLAPAVVAPLAPPAALDHRPGPGRHARGHSTATSLIAHRADPPCDAFSRGDV